MDIIRDLFYTNKSVFKNSIYSLKRNWMIIFTGIFYFFATIVLYSFLRYMSILAGLVLIIATSALISNYLYLIKCIIERNQFNIHDFKEGFGVYLRKVWGVLFIGWVASLILEMFFMPVLISRVGPIAFVTIVNFLTFILFNTVPETIYQKHYNPWETIIYSVNFMKESWIEWLVPNSILLSIFYILTGTFLSGVFNYHASFATIFMPSRGLLYYLVGQILFSFIMIYRGMLFDALSTSNRRKRLFMRKF